MTEEEVRARAQAVCDALVAGDIDRAIEDLSDELRRNLGEVVALLPLPAKEAAVESIERTASGFLVIVRIVSETEEVQVQTRWKDRDGQPKIVEASHLSSVAREEEAAPDDADADGAGEASEAG
jgi:hypothetical protein